MHHCYSIHFATNFMLRTALWAVVVNLTVCLSSTAGREAEHDSENSILNLFDKQFGKQNIKPNFLLDKKDSFISPLIFFRETSEQNEISGGFSKYFPKKHISKTAGPAKAPKLSPKKSTLISHPKSQSFVKITFTSPQLIGRSMRKRLKKIKASKVASSELSLNKVESLTTNHLHKEFPKPESAPSFSDILRPELGSLFDRVEHASVQLLQTVLKQQLPLEEYTGNSIQDSFFGSSPASQAYQPEVGGSCFSSLGEPGMCVPVEDCPQLRPLTKQLHVKNAVILLVQQLCRLGEENFFVCCEYPAFQNPPYAVGSANAVLPRFQKSLFGAPLPSEGECGVVGPQPADEDGQHRQLESHEWPWLVAIGRILDREAFNVLCSGTLFTRRHVLTAASCFYLQEIRQPTMVRVGEHDTSVREGNAHQDFLIIGRNDPGWVLFFNQENLMVLTLERDITFSEYVQPACLPPPDISVPDVGSSVASASWKRSRRARNVSEDSQPPSPVLASLEVVSLRECQTAYSNLEANFFLVDARNICVVEEETSPQCCVSVGAPVMKKRDDGAYELVGVVTVPSIPTQYVPTVGTRVSAYRDWLEYVVEG